MIKAILFDIDGVLVDSRWANWDFLNRIWKKYGFRFIPEKDYAKKYFNLPLKEVIKTLLSNLNFEKQEKIFQTGKKTKYDYRALHITSKEAIYVGDSLTDLQAAKAIGMKFIGFYGISGNIFKEAEANIKTFAELPGVIKKLEGK